MDAITVKELKAKLDALILHGYGDHTIQISSDDEGNEFHTLRGQVSADTKLFSDIEAMGLFHDRDVDVSKIIILE